MYCLPVGLLKDQFENKILTEKELLATTTNYQDPCKKVIKKQILFKIGDRVHIRSKVPLKHNSGHIMESVDGTIIDIAPFGGNGGMTIKNGIWCIKQEPIYKIKLDQVTHVIAIGNIDEIVSFNTTLMTKI
jgi:hypothetical protein